MKNFNYTIKTFVLYLILPICLFLLFEKAIISLISTLVVNTIFQHFDESKLVYDISTLIAVLIVLVPIVIKLFKRAKLDLRKQIAIIDVITIYGYFRFINKSFEFLSISFSNEFKLLDILACGLCLILLINWSIKKTQTNAILSLNGFTVDEPRTDDQNDILNRSKFIEGIVRKIDETDTKYGSFPIGIVAKWGTGKTTFIKRFISKLDSNKYISIELNAWKCNGSEQIIESLFGLLRSELGPYSFTIDNKLQDYATSLLKESGSSTVNVLKNINDLFVSNSLLENQYAKINKEIKSINKKIIIVIDDLDRLDKKEIFETIRLIRNTASFAKTFFVVAYDRNYILNAIEEINQHQSHYYLEKIFQIEFTLPPISDSILQNEITRRLENVLTAEDFAVYLAMINKGYRLFETADSNLTTLFINNIRDVVRFINSLLLTYEFVKGEVYLIDFYNLELIRFKHPELFVDIYQQNEAFFGSEITPGHTIRFDQQISLVDSSKKQFEDYLNKKSSEYKLSDEDIATLIKAYSSVFYQYKNNTKIKEGYNSHLSVVIPSMYDRYFVLDIGSDLSEIEFSKMRSSSNNVLIKKIDEIVRTPKLINQLNARFESIKIFDNKEDFEKIIEAIFYFANLNNKENSYRNFIGFNEKAIYELFEKQKIEKYYSDSSEFKKFLTKILKTESIKYTFNNIFSKELLKNGLYFIEYLFTSEELETIIFDNFNYAITNSDKLTFDLYWLFYLCIERQKTTISNNHYEIRHFQSERSLKIMRRFICEKDMDGFLLNSIRQSPFEIKFLVEKDLSVFFKSAELFERFLILYKKPSLYKDEFLRLLNTLRDPLYKGGVDYDFFKVIPVEVRK